MHSPYLSYEEKEDKNNITKLSSTETPPIPNTCPEIIKALALQNNSSMSIIFKKDIRFQRTARIATRKGRLALFRLSRCHLETGKCTYNQQPCVLYYTIWNPGCTPASVIRLDSLSSYYYRIIHRILVSDPSSLNYVQSSGLGSLNLTS